jgi:hypothetical protein
MEFWLPRSLSHELFLFCTMGFWLSGSLSHELFFSRWDSGYQGAFLMNFFFMMEFWLSGSVFTNFCFSWWNLGYHGAFSRISLSHDGISAITEPFHEFFFLMMESRLSRSLFTNFSFSWWNLDYRGAFSRIFFHMMESRKCTILGKTLSIYMTKCIYIGSASLKTLSLDLEPPLQGKEYGPPYSNVIA